MADALTETSTAMKTYTASGSAADAAAARASVVRTQEVVERHLAHEENELEPELQPHLETPEWKAVEKKLRSGSPVRGGRMFAWLLDGASPEVSGYVHRSVPGPVLFLLTRVFGIGYQRGVAPVWRT